MRPYGGISPRVGRDTTPAITIRIGYCATEPTRSRPVEDRLVHPMPSARAWWMWSQQAKHAYRAGVAAHRPVACCPSGCPSAAPCGWLGQPPI